MDNKEGYNLIIEVQNGNELSKTEKLVTNVMLLTREKLNRKKTSMTKTLPAGF